MAHGAAGTVAEGVTVAVTGGGDPRRAAAVRDAVLAGLDSGLLPVRRQRPQAGAEETPAVGRVALVGGGPGDPGLVTVRGRQLLAAADVVVTDRLGPRDLLDVLSPDVEVVDVGKTPGHHPIPQSRINEILVEHAQLGRNVVRLKGGDPFVLGRGGEEAIHCAANGIPVEVVPGVTSAVSVPAAAGIPVTHRGITASFVVASAHDGATSALDALRDAPVTSTVVLLMGVTALAETARRLVESGRPSTTPVALVESGWTPAQRTTVTTLADAAEVAEREGVRSPAVVVVGEVVRIREQVGDLVPPTLLAEAAPSLVLLAHGSPDPRHAKGVERVAEQVRRRWPGHVHAAYLDHHPPSATEVAERLDGGVLVPLLLTTAYHVKTDVPEAAAAMDALGRGHYAVAGALGPDPLLFTAADELLARAGFVPDPHTGVVLFAGGSSDRDAISAIGDAVDGQVLAGWGPVGGRRTGRWRRRRGGRGPASGRGSAARAGGDLHGRRGRAARPDGDPRREGRRRGRAGHARRDRRPRRPARPPRTRGADRGRVACARVRRPPGDPGPARRPGAHPDPREPRVAQRPDAVAVARAGRGGGVAAGARSGWW